MLTRDALVRLCRARDLLREVHDQPLSIRDVARDAAMSPYHFIRQFEALPLRTNGGTSGRRCCARSSRYSAAIGPGPSAR